MQPKISDIHAFLPVTIATVVTLALYFQQALLLLLKLSEVFNGVFDTSVPTFPLAGMMFVLVFILLRNRVLGRFSPGPRPDAP